VILPSLPFWLSGSVQKAFHSLGQNIASQIELQLEALFESGRIKHMTATGLEILWADMPIRPDGLSTDLQRYFAQYYDQIMDVVATGPGLDLIKVIFGLSMCTHIEMRSSPNGGDYSWTTVRLWINPVTPATRAKIDTFYKLMLPARCIIWRQLVEWNPGTGFGSAPFGHSFGL